jgi:hypothetical protein
MVLDGAKILEPDCSGVLPSVTPSSCVLLALPPDQDGHGTCEGNYYEESTGQGRGAVDFSR